MAGRLRAAALDRPDPRELMAGDLRRLYLAWLLAVQNREVDEDAVEPPVPAGIGGVTRYVRTRPPMDRRR